MNTKKKNFYVLIRFLISFTLIGTLFYKIDLHGLIARLQSLNIYWFLIMIMLPHLNILLSSIKWQWLLGALNITENLGHLFITYMIGTFFSNLLPSMVGGDVVRVLRLSRGNADSSGIIAATFTERFMGLTALISILFIVLCHPKIYDVFPVITKIAAMAVAIYIVILFIIFQKKSLSFLSRFKCYSFVRKILELAEESQLKICKYTKQKRVVLASYLISVAFYMVSILTVYVASKSLNLHIQIDVIMMVVPLVLLVGLLPISIGGMGLNEGSYIFFFSLFGVPSVDAFSIALLLRLRILMTGSIGGLMFANSKTKQSQQKSTER